MFRNIVQRTAIGLSLGLAMLFSTTVLNADSFQLVYTDTFTNQDSLYLASSKTPVAFSGDTPFQVVATFDASTPDFHLPGFNAYVPTSAVLKVGGNSYSMTNADVSIFDSTFSTGNYAAGFISNPAQDGAGFVADFASVSTPFSVDSLVPTTFFNYNGTGFQSGVGYPSGCRGNCQGHLNQPFTLVASDGTDYLLSFPSSLLTPPFPEATAQLYSLTPEPGAGLLTLVGMVGVFGGTLLARRTSTAAIR